MGDDNVSMISGASGNTGRMSGRMSSMSSSIKGFNSMGNPITHNPLANFSPENPYINPFMMNQFTHGGPVSPNPYNMHPNLIAHQNMMQTQAMRHMSQMTASVSPSTQTKTEEIGASLASLSVRDSDSLSQSPG